VSEEVYFFTKARYLSVLNKSQAVVERIERLEMALKAARSNLHEIEAGDMSTFEAIDAINVALGDLPE